VHGAVARERSPGCFGSACGVRRPRAVFRPKWPIRVGRGDACIVAAHARRPELRHAVQPAAAFGVAGRARPDIDCAARSDVGDHRTAGHPEHECSVRPGSEQPARPPLGGQVARLDLARDVAFRRWRVRGDPSDSALGDSSARDRVTPEARALSAAQPAAETRRTCGDGPASRARSRAALEARRAPHPTRAARYGAEKAARVELADRKAERKIRAFAEPVRPPSLTRGFFLELRDPLL